MDTLIALMIFAVVPVAVALWQRKAQAAGALPAGIVQQMQGHAACE